MNIEETIYKQHVHHTKWSSRLHFYADEVRIIANKLEEMSATNDHDAFNEGADYFHEQVMLQNASIAEIHREIRANEQELVAEIIRNPTAISARRKAYREREQKSMLLFEIGFNALRDDFHWFHANWADQSL